MTQTNDSQSPRIGVAVIITRGDKVLVGHRTSRLYTDFWAVPGGKLDFGETVEACARRETIEETSISTQGPIRKLGWEDDLMPQYDAHFVTLYVHIDDSSNIEEARIPACEADKCSELRWVTLSDLGDLELWPNTFGYIEHILGGH